MQKSDMRAIWTEAQLVSWFKSEESSKYSSLSLQAIIKQAEWTM